jgi:hypothetical protein
MDVGMHLSLGAMDGTDGMIPRIDDMAGDDSH